MVARGCLGTGIVPLLQESETALVRIDEATTMERRRFLSSTLPDRFIVHTRVALSQEPPECVRTVFQGVGHVVTLNESREGRAARV